MLRWLLGPFTVGLFVVACAVVLAGVNLLAVPVAADDKPDKESPKTVTVDLGGEVKMEFVLIPKGKFTMGSPKDEKERGDDEVQHEVEITKPFYMAKYPVTQEQYQAMTGKNPSYFSKSGEDKDSRERVKGLDTKQFPVEIVLWDDAQAFCKKMAENDKQKRKFRLPTEAEWEYACRAGTTTPFSFGSELNGKQANCDGDRPYGTTDKGPSKNRTSKVGEYRENNWGLCDMHGNVDQWCEDYYGPYKDLNQQDPLRTVKGLDDSRVVRGGSWIVAAKDCRAASRARIWPGLRGSYVGFRVAFRLD